MSASPLGSFIVEGEKRHLPKAIRLILKNISTSGSMNHYLASFLSYGYKRNVTSNF